MKIKETSLSPSPTPSLSHTQSTNIDISANISFGFGVHDIARVLAVVLSHPPPCCLPGGEQLSRGEADWPIAITTELDSRGNLGR